MPNQVGTSQVIRFATFEVDLQAQELRKGGLRLKLSGQPFQVLAILLEQPGVVVTREELQKRLWPDTFVDVDHNLNTAINKIREALGDSSENPRFVETLPRRGYRFIAPITVNGTAAAAVTHTPENRSTSVPKSVARTRPLLVSGLLGTVMVLVAGGLWIYKRSETPGPPPQRTLTRITFDDGLQSEPTWSPDGRYIAYSSDRGGKFDIWVQQVSGGDPIQIDQGTGAPLAAGLVARWQIHRVSFRGRGGRNKRCPSSWGRGTRTEDRVFCGYYPHWSPDGSQVLFQNHFTVTGHWSRFYVAQLDGSAPREVLAEFIAQNKRVGGFSRLVPRWKESHCLGRRSFAKSQLLDSTDCRGGWNQARKLLLRSQKTRRGVYTG